MENEKELDYGVYMIYSDMSLKDIATFVNTYDKDGSSYGTIRLDYAKDQKTGEYCETNRTVMTLKKTVANTLISEGFGTQNSYDFTIVPYQFRENSVPPQGTAYALFIPVPSELSKNEAQTQLHEKMETVKSMGYVTEKDFVIHLPNTSREDDGKFRGQAIITFKETVPRRYCVEIKTILNMTRFISVNSEGETDTHFCHVNWCKISALMRLTSNRSKKIGPSFVAKGLKPTIKDVSLVKTLQVKLPTKSSIAVTKTISFANMATKEIASLPVPVVTAPTVIEKNDKTVPDVEKNDETVPTTVEKSNETIWSEGSK